MIINSLLAFSQKKTIMLYKKSSILRNIDWLIFANIILVILTSSVAQSDSIAIFAISTIILTTIKLLTKPNEKLSLTLGDFFLLIYFYQYIQNLCVTFLI